MIEDEIKKIFNNAKESVKGDISYQKDPYHRGITHTNAIYEFCLSHTLGHPHTKNEFKPIFLASHLHDLANLYSTNSSHELKIVCEMIKVEKKHNLLSPLNKTIFTYYGEQQIKINSLGLKKVQKAVQDLLNNIFIEIKTKNRSEIWDLTKILILATQFGYMETLKHEQLEVRKKLMSQLIYNDNEQKSIIHNILDPQEIRSLIKDHLFDQRLDNYLEHVIYDKELTKLVNQYKRLCKVDHRSIIKQILLIRSADLAALFDIKLYDKIEDDLILSFNHQKAVDVDHKITFYKLSSEWLKAQLELTLDLYIFHNRLILAGYPILQDKSIQGLESMILELTSRLWKSQHLES